MDELPLENVDTLNLGKGRGSLRAGCPDEFVKGIDRIIPFKHDKPSTVIFASSGRCDSGIESDMLIQVEVLRIGAVIPSELLRPEVGREVCAKMVRVGTSKLTWSSSAV